MFLKKSLPWCPRLRNGRQSGPKWLEMITKMVTKSRPGAAENPISEKTVIFDGISDGSGPSKSIKVHNYRRFHGFRTARK